MKPIVIGNWKAYVSSVKEGYALIKGIEKKLARRLSATVVVCPPAPLLGVLRTKYGGKRILFGAQDVSVLDDTPTGDIRPGVIKDVGAKYVIIGHADRRKSGDTDEVVRDKIKAALSEKLIPVVCVGEEVRDAEGAYLSVLEKSILDSFDGISELELKKIIIAYEPVWAIGAPMPPSPRTIQETLIFIRKTLAMKYPRALALKIPILYGGAVDDTNADGLIQDSGASGFLIGRASAHPEAFATIVNAWK